MLLHKILPKELFSAQARKPSGILGRFFMAKLFTKGNANLNGFTLRNLELASTDRVLEIGFGPGNLVRDMAQITTKGRVQGVDFSDAMLKTAEKNNKDLIREGRVALQKGDCEQLAFDDGSFEKACSVNTIYFWEKPLVCLGEILRVLTPGGRVVLGFTEREQMKKLALSKNVFTMYSPGEVAGLLDEAGFRDVAVLDDKGKPFTSFCAVGVKA